MNSIVKLIAIIIISVHPSLSTAWNNFGHEVIAAQAYARLTPTAKQRVAALLKLNPNYGDWVEGASADKQDQAAFIRASTWADYIRRLPDYRDDKDSKGRATGKSGDYSDKLIHGNWHYIDLPFSPDGTALKQPKVPNAQTQIAAFRRALADSNIADANKSYALVWLLHLVGDVHQPLHATSRFTRDAIKGDRGGNEVALCEKRCDNELHAYWDRALGTSDDLDKAVAYANKLPVASASKATIADEGQWIEESFRIAKKSVYADPIGTGLGPYTLSTQYKKAAKNIARSRAALAGIRLADLINNELK